jgi:predicted transposase YbfD/YdcC
MDPSDSSEVWNSTRMTPDSVADSSAAANVNMVAQRNEIDTALSQYNQIRSKYNEILNEAITTQDPAKRAQLVSTITAMNQQLSTIVASIQQMYQSNQAAISELPPIDFAADLDKYKKDLSDLMMEKDELTKLKIIHATMTPPAQPYYLYVVAILLMLIILLIMFTFTSLMTGASSVVSSMPSLSEVSSGSSSAM